MPYGCQQQQFERKNTNKTAEKPIFRKENLQFEKKNKKKTKYSESKFKADIHCEKKNTNTIIVKLKLLLYIPYNMEPVTKKLAYMRNQNLIFSKISI